MCTAITQCLCAFAGKSNEIDAENERVAEYNERDDNGDHENNERDAENNERKHNNCSATKPWFFGKLYAKQCLPNNESTHAKLQQDFRSMYATYVEPAFDTQSAVNVELVDFVIRGLKHGKAAGPDGIFAERLLYSHPWLGSDEL